MSHLKGADQVVLHLLDVEGLMEEQNAGDEVNGAIIGNGHSTDRHSVD